MPTSNHHEAWNIVRSGPSGFPGGPWVKGVDKRDERERGKDLDRREMPHIKDEKDRYCRLLNLKGWVFYKLFLRKKYELTANLFIFSEVYS